MRFLSNLLFGAALLASVTIPVTLQAQTYRDEKNHDEHKWDSHEDKAYHIWVKQNHRKYVEFSKARAEDQQSYWSWRHEHSDAVLKINIK